MVPVNASTPNRYPVVCVVQANLPCINTGAYTATQDKIQQHGHATHVRNTGMWPNQRSQSWPPLARSALPKVDALRGTPSSGPLLMP